MDKSLSKLQEIVNDGKPGVLQFMGYKESKLNNNHNTEQQYHSKWLKKNNTECSPIFTIDHL